MNPCKVCGEDTDLFTEIYDLEDKTSRDIYLCAEHHARLYRTIRGEIARMVQEQEASE